MFRKLINDLKETRDQLNDNHISRYIKSHPQAKIQQKISSFIYIPIIFWILDFVLISLNHNQIFRVHSVFELLTKLLAHVSLSIVLFAMGIYGLWTGVYPNWRFGSKYMYGWKPNNSSRLFGFGIILVSILQFILFGLSSLVLFVKELR